MANGSGVLQLQRPTTSGDAWTAVWLQVIPDGPTSITPGPGGSLYVTTLDGKIGKGAILKLIPPASPGGGWKQAVIYELASMGQGGVPNFLAVASDGTLYGTTLGNAIFGEAAATVFELTPPASPGGDWTYTMLENFGDGHQLEPPLILRGGRLFGAIVGLQDAVFTLAPASSGNAWTLNFLHDFTAQEPGFSVVGDTQVMDGGGTIYGATFVHIDGESATGTVYRIAP